MKVYVLPADTHGCGHYRLIWPANILQHQGHDIVIVPPEKGSGFGAKTGLNSDGSEKLLSVQVPDDVDVLVIQRPAHPLQHQMIQIMRSNGIAVVVDIDDDMSSIHPDNAAFTMYRPRSNTAFSWRETERSCRVATLVTTSTKTLQRTYAKHGRGMVIDNYVPRGYLNFDQVTTGNFGWAGTLKSHPNDLQVTRPAVQRLLDEGYTFKGVGDGTGTQAAMGTKEIPEFTGTVSIKDWARTIAASMDVGMIPLSMGAFNTAKSRLKGIEMSSVGVPWVASPREEYRRLVKESQAGLLANTPKEWYVQVKRLLTDDGLRQELIEAGREFMIKQTYEENAWRHWEAWTRAFEIQRGHIGQPSS